MILKDHKLSDGPLPLIFLDLAQSATQAEVEKKARVKGHDQPRPPINGHPRQPWNWRYYDEQYMHQLIGSQTGHQSWEDWGLMEEERNLLGLFENIWQD